MHCAASVFNSEVQVSLRVFFGLTVIDNGNQSFPYCKMNSWNFLFLAIIIRTGDVPAIWLRCIIADRIDQIIRPEDLRPIIYLPGISRQDIRAVESCPDHLKPLAELQYRGVIWSQANAKDWTVLAFLKSSQGGMGLDVSQDTESKNAMLAGSSQASL